VTIETFEDARAAVAAGVAPADAAGELVQRLMPHEKLWCLDGDSPTWAGLGFLTQQDGYHRAPFLAARVERVGIPGIAFADGPRGAVVGNATCFPVAMARGATWDVGIEERVGEAIGRELRAQGATLTGAVCVNVLRHPAWGRAQETYGEDPFHVGEMGAAVTRGLQRHVMACVKHFACNSMENARFSVDVEVDDVALHEVYLPHFRRIVDEGVASVMSAYNSVNGEWCGQSHALLTDVLRGEWGFQGFVISDWILGLRDAATSLAAGLDIEMPYRMVRATHLPGALERGEASWDDVDAAVTRTLSTLLRFDHLVCEPAPAEEAVGSDEHRALAREVAGRSVVVLRNEAVGGTPALPLDPGSRVVLFGALAGLVNVGDGGSSDVWDLDCHPLVDGLRTVFPSTVHDDGTDLGRVAEVAAGADAAVVVVGYTYRDEGEYIGETDPSLGALFPPGDEPDVVDLFQASIADLPSTERPSHLQERPRGFSMGGDRSSLRLAPADVTLVRAVAAANPRTIVVLQAGSAVVVSDWVGEVPALVQAWYGGCRAGEGLADVLSGALNPSGRLPFSVPVSEEDLPVFDRDATRFRYDRWHGWWFLQREGHEPAFPFGFGCSYTTFDVAVVAAHQDGDGVVVEGRVRNTGERDGADVVQVYAELPDPDAPPRLVGFARVEVGAGSEAPFRIPVRAEALALRDADRRSWRPVRGHHVLRVGRFAGDPAAAVVEIDLG
jgi:beta-glucosidase